MIIGVCICKSEGLLFAVAPILRDASFDPLKLFWCSAPAVVCLRLNVLHKMEPKADIALIGLAVMGQNLILNMNDHGFTVVAFNRTAEKVDQFLANEAKGTKVIGAHSIEEMIAQLKRPRRVMLMVKAGKPVDEFIE